MKKAELTALVNTLRAIIDDERGNWKEQIRAVGKAEQRAYAAELRVRILEQQLAAQAAAPPAPAYRIAMEDSYYRPAREGETPDILVTDLREGHPAQNLPYVKVR